MHGNGLPWMALPLAQGTIDEQERMGIAALYGGNALTPGVGRIMCSLAAAGGLASSGGIAGTGGGLAS